jgi:hypothetical protein
LGAWAHQAAPAQAESALRFPFLVRQHRARLHPDVAQALADPADQTEAPVAHDRQDRMRAANPAMVHPVATSQILDAKGLNRGDLRPDDPPSVAHQKPPGSDGDCG